MAEMRLRWGDCYHPIIVLMASVSCSIWSLHLMDELEWVLWGVIHKNIRRRDGRRKKAIDTVNIPNIQRLLAPPSDKEVNFLGKFFAFYCWKNYYRGQSCSGNFNLLLSRWWWMTWKHLLMNNMDCFAWIFNVLTGLSGTRVIGLVWT